MVSLYDIQIQLTLLTAKADTKPHGLTILVKKQLALLTSNTDGCTGHSVKN